MTLLKGILSIQSQVVYGHVGNSAGVPALQNLGHEVWPLPTVLFSNHPGHGQFTGAPLPAQDLRALLDGLKARGVMSRLSACLSGYLGDASHVDIVVDAVTTMRAGSPGAPYCCDPVMGDTDKGTYVKPDLPDAIRKKLVPLADILRPNAYELGLLTGHAITDPASAVAAARTLPAPLTVCTSIPLTDDPGAIGMVAVTPDKAWLVKAPRLASPPPGTGDLFTALFLGHFLKGASAPDALTRTASTLSQALSRLAPGPQVLDLPLGASQPGNAAPSALTVKSL